MKIKVMFSLLFLLAAPLAAQKTIYSGTPNEPQTLDPAQAWDAQSSFFIQNIFDTLVTIDPGNNQVLPALAVSWEMSPDGLRWVFRLRQGVFFHDRTPVNPEAVVFSFQRQLDPESKYRPAESPMFGEIFSQLKEVRAVDAERVEFILREPFAPFLQALSVDCAAIVSPAALRGSGADFTRRPVGSGPFMLKSWEPGQRLILEANRDYWRGSPQFDSFVNIFEPNHEMLNSMFQQEKIDMMFTFSISRLAAMRRISWVRIFEAPLLSAFYLALNLDRPLLADRRFRRALHHLWDDKILTLVFQGVVNPITSVFPRGLPGGLGMLPGYEYQPEKAAELLRALNLKNQLSLDLVYADTSPLVRQLLNYYARNLARVGIRLNLVKVSEAERDARVIAGDYDLTLSGWISDYPDPDSILTALTSSELQRIGFANLSALPRPDLFGLVAGARTSLDERKRTAMYLEVEKIIKDEAAIIPIYQDKTTIIHHDRINGLQESALGRLFLFTVSKREKE